MLLSPMYLKDELWIIDETKRLPLAAPISGLSLSINFLIGEPLTLTPFSYVSRKLEASS